MASVTLDRVTKMYGTVKAVDEVSIEVRDKEFLVLVGPSGCGKSTSLRMIAGLEDISDGRILIGDRVVNEVLPKDRDIAMVFQSYALYPHMSVRDNMAFGLKLRHTPRTDIARRVKEAASILGLEDLLERKPKELSGGQRQRVALGRAIVREPKVFLMDEPLSNLDAKLRVQTRAELIKLHNRLQTTVIYVTHDQVEAMTMGSRIAVMKDGLLQQLDGPQCLYEHPANTFVAEFIGSPSMNFLTGKLAGSAEAPYFESEQLRIPVNKKLAKNLGQTLTAGMRPEHISIRINGTVARQLGGSPANGADGFTYLPTYVEVVEPLGSEAIVYLCAGKHNLIARAAYRSDLRAGSHVEAALESEKLYLFDAASGQAL